MWSVKRAMPYKEQEKALLGSGRRGQAEIVSSRFTGTVGDGRARLQEWGTYKFSLRVTPDGDEAPFDVSLHMRLPGNVSGERGTRFPVLFDPENHQFMIVDPSIVPRSKEELLTARNYAPSLDATGGPASPEILAEVAARELADPLAGAGLRQKLMAAAVGVPRTAPADMAEKLRYALLGQKLMTSGVEAPAVINTVNRSGDVQLGGAVDAVIEVTIKPAEGDAYAATIRQPLLPAVLDGFSTGDAITVRCDPQDPTAALIYRW